jgi:RNA polymerase sigma-70 factor (ECF subfamily)|tara:strand:+ start:2318 stop:2998 length:681 start_codon:yes stop_codon:yes gene_type:complete
MNSETKKSVNNAPASLAQNSLSPGANEESANTISIKANSRRNPGVLSPSGYAWGEWLAENGPRMLLFARQQTRTAEDAEDVLQDALVKLARKVDEGTFDGGQESWKPYLYTAIRRLSIDLGRKNDRRSKREEKSEGDRRGENGGMSDPWFENGAANDESRSLLQNGLKKLPVKFSEVIVMKIWGEHTFAEIGEILGVSLNTVASRYRYGLERLRKGLEPSRAHNDI